MKANNAAAVRDLNDSFRKGNTSIPGTAVMTIGIHSFLAEKGEEFEALINEVREFEDFNEDRGPNDEHDFGKFNYLGKEIYWKIDLYNPNYDGKSEDPTDPSKTCRVLTVMLAHEY